MKPILISIVGTVLLFSLWPHGGFRAQADASDLRVTPVGDSATVELTHPSLPGQVFKIRMPEYIDVYTPRFADKVKWEEKKGGWAFCWDQTEEIKQKCYVDFSGTVEVEGERVHITFTLKALRASGARYWPFDIVCGGAPQFHDPKGERTFFRRGDRFVSINEMEQGNLADPPCGSFYYAKNPEAPGVRDYTARLAAKISKEGQWVLSIASDLGQGSSYNLLPETSCIHQNFQWESLSPGSEQTVHLWIHLFKGSLEDAWKLHRVDSESTLYAADQSVPDSRHNFLPTVWATSETPPSLRKIRALRPKLPEHALAPWVADTLIRRRNGAPVTVEEIEQQLRGFASRNGFLIRDDSSGLWVSNGKLGIAFAPARTGMGIMSLYDVKNGVEFLSGSPGSVPVPWKLVVLPQKGTPGVVGFFPSVTGPRTNELVSLDGRGAVPRYRIRADKGTLELVTTWDSLTVPGVEGKGQVTTCLRMTADSPFSQWRIEVGSDFRQAGLAQVLFPYVQSLGVRGENDLAKAWGCGMGQLFRKNSQVFTGIYPSSQWTLQMLSLSYGATSLYLACHDSDACTKSFYLNPGGEFYFGPYPENTGLTQSYRQPYEVVVGAVEGDWFDCAREYHKWALRQKWCRKGPLAGRKDLCRRMAENDLWVKPGYDFASSIQNSLRPPLLHPEEELYQNVRAFGSDVATAVWWYSWYQERFDEGDPVFTPYPDIIEIFKKETKDGFLLTPYTLAEEWDVTTSHFKTEAACKLLDGTPYLRQWVRCKTAGVCPATQPVKQTYLDLARQVSRDGADSLYYDGQAGCIYDCYDRTHGHPLGIGGARWAKELRETLERVRRDRGATFGMTGEYWCEPYLDLYDVQQTTSYGWIEPSEVPLLPAIYGGYVATMAAPTHGHFPDDLPGFRLKIGRSLIWGRQLGGGMFSEYLHDEGKKDFLRRALRIRQLAGRFFVYGQMVRPPVLRSPVPQVPMKHFAGLGATQSDFTYGAVEPSAWLSAEGKLLIVLVNYDEKAHSVRLAVPRQWKAVLGYTSESKQAKLTLVHGDAEVEAPGGDFVLLTSEPLVAQSKRSRKTVGLERRVRRFYETLQLPERRGQSVGPVLLRRIKDSDGEVRRAACYALANSGVDTEGAAAALMGRLQDTNLSVRFAAALALGRSGNKVRAAVPRLMKLARSDNRRLVWVALVALGQANSVSSSCPASEEVVTFVSRFLDDPREEAVLAAHFALGRMGVETESHVQALADLHKTDNADFQLGSVTVLGLLGETAKPALPVLLNSLRTNGWWEVRRDCAWALHLIAPDDGRVTEALWQVSGNDGNLEVRQVAAQMLRPVASSRVHTEERK